MPTSGKRRRVVTAARREQNRLAQQSLRERKDKRLVELEAELEEVKATNRALEAQLKELRKIILTSMGGKSDTASPSSATLREIMPTPLSSGAVTSEVLDRVVSSPNSLSTLPAIPLRASHHDSARVLARAVPTRFESAAFPTTESAPSSDNNHPPDVSPSTNPHPTFVTIPSSGLTSVDPNPPWLADMMSLPSEAPDLFATLNQDPIPGQWAHIEPQSLHTDPYSLDNLDFLFGWDAGNMSFARQDTDHLFNSVDFVGQPLG
ncbi:hypothetical protein EHS25_001317 [Saitozyma podzolica]|uniref:BZIP domain-containing protein n=1 Tax=Saitozyma podzolica TaxID=1890683 RepID=A0A427YGB1_9TREE|nr:hypothetical protein EHS25_001317 [Saitozyma podzolica]